ncbi:MAG: hypothetical protein D6732_24080 [Methanobacteriota archaeon]|nr:MAG: hypothetical protein D6732_24080 [Euryarchaeota archaeon]
MVERIVISQPMYFPWVGLLEQARLADVFVHYDDVQFSKGSFSNRVQVKTGHGIKWLTIPLRKHRLGQKINEIIIDESKNWRGQHYDILRQAYRNAPYKEEMLSIADEVFSIKSDKLVDITIASFMVLVKYFGLDAGRQFIKSSQLAIAGESSQRVHDIVLHFGGRVYITGHGAKNYLDHELFERSEIEVRYVKYERREYPQLHGVFTPYVSALDLIANCGKDGKKYIVSETVNWKEFLNGSH